MRHATVLVFEYMLTAPTFLISQSEGDPHWRVIRNIRVPRDSHALKPALHNRIRWHHVVVLDNRESKSTRSSQTSR